MGVEHNNKKLLEWNKKLQILPDTVIEDIDRKVEIFLLEAINSSIETSLGWQF